MSGLFMWKDIHSTRFEAAISSLRNFVSAYTVCSVRMVGSFVVFEGHSGSQIGILILNAKDAE